jgi:hypothetical protein
MFSHVSVQQTRLELGRRRIRAVPVPSGSPLEPTSFSPLSLARNLLPSAVARSAHDSIMSTINIAMTDRDLDLRIAIYLPW